MTLKYFQSCHHTRITQTFNNSENPGQGVQRNTLGAIVDCHVQKQRQRTVPKVNDLQGSLHDDSDSRLHAKKLLPHKLVEPHHSTIPSIGARPILALENVGQDEHLSKRDKTSTAASNGTHARKLSTFVLGSSRKLCCFCN